MTQTAARVHVSSEAIGFSEAAFWEGLDQKRWPGPIAPADKRVLVAGIGNVLRQDDGFGPAVIKALEKAPGLPPEVQTIEVGIGGLGLVLELIDGYEILIIVDAVERGGQPGSLYMLEPVIPDLSTLVDPTEHDLGTDMHQIGPGKALIMARALGVLPKTVRIIGCQPGETENFSLELSQPVQKSVSMAVQMILEFLNRLPKK